MSKRRRQTLFEDLPGDIIDKILIRLPSKDVGRCRAVSTSWCNATSTSEFMLEHHRSQPSLPIIDKKGGHAGLKLLGAGACIQQLWPFHPRAKRRFKTFLHATCDGLLIVSRESQFYICNPVTRKHALLRLPQVGKNIRNTPIGFYRHHPTGEYRVLWVTQSEHRSEHLSISCLHVFTVGANEPRRVLVRMPTVLSPSVEQKLLWKMCPGCHCPPPVHHRGSLFWCPYGAINIAGGGGDIIVFDTEAESFRWMHSPTQSYPYRKLFNMKGTLALWGCSTRSFTTIDVWVMQDYKAEIWTFKYRIDLSTVEASRQLYLTSFKNEKKKPLDSAIQRFNDMVALNEHELLIKFNGKHVLHCDIDGNFLGMVGPGTRQYHMSLTQHRLQESIIPFPSHEMHREDKELPFSTGHF